MRFTVLIALTAIFTLGTTQAHAQEAQDPVQDELRTMVTETDQAEADRAVVREFLQRDDVQQVAGENGLDIERAEAGVRTLSAAQVANIADRITDAEGQLVGGDTVIITSTTIIIILLILLLLSV